MRKICLKSAHIVHKTDRNQTYFLHYTYYTQYTYNTHNIYKVSFEDKKHL